MNNTISDLITILASKRGKKYDFSTKMELARIFDYVRSFFLRRSLEKRPQDRRHVTQSLSVELIKVDNPFKAGKILRSKDRLPEPLRSNDILFDYVGNMNGEAIQYVNSEEAHFMLYNTYTANRIKYSYVDGYIYIHNNLRLCDLLVKGIFNNPSSLMDCENDYYPVPEDLVAPIMEYIIKNELQLGFTEEEKQIKDETNSKT